MTTNWKHHFKKCSHSLIKLHQSYSISFNLANVGEIFGLNPKGQYLSLEEEKDNFCVVFTYSVKQACEIRKFHVAGVQPQQRNVQNSMMHFKFVVLSIKTFNGTFLPFSFRRHGYWFCCHPEIVLPWWHDVILLSTKLTIKFQQGCALRGVEGTHAVLWNCEVHGVQHVLFMEKKPQDSLFTQEEKLGVRQGPLGDSRALPFSITHDPPGVVAPSFY